ncbi:arsenate reductase family protein [Saccharicrinis aurantiacus]|uniref:arsenate reductase family protein n=1 Tax=Saccharicrinis aurantiacus TaxID=1849719 RepID=UPI002491575D|nr:ArsC/Spx/MgsR family protein [Saccharicrinis aurantiacus]
MKKIYYLSTCSTCRRIIKEINPDSSFIFQDLKEMPISAIQLDHLSKLTGGYASVFNRQARKYRELSLHTQELTEAQIRRYILNEYTLLKRPIFIVNDQVFVGNSRKVISALADHMTNVNSKVVNSGT